MCNSSWSLLLQVLLAPPLLLALTLQPPALIMHLLPPPTSSYCSYLGRTLPRELALSPLQRRFLSFKVRPFDMQASFEHVLLFGDALLVISHMLLLMLLTHGLTEVALPSLQLLAPLRKILQQGLFARGSRSQRSSPLLSS